MIKKQDNSQVKAFNFVFYLKFYDCSEPAFSEMGLCMCKDTTKPVVKCGVMLL